MTSIDATRLFPKNYCSGIRRMYIKIPQFQLDTRPGSMCWSPVSQGVVSCVWLCTYTEKPKTLELHFLWKFISFSVPLALWDSPLHSPLRRTGSGHSSWGGSRTWSVSHG